MTTRLTLLLTRTPFSSIYSSTSSGDSSPVCGKVSPTSSGSICWPSLFILVVVTTRLTLLLTRTPFSSIYSSTSSGDSSPVCGKVSPTSSGSICWPSLFILVVVTTRLTLLLTRTPFSSIYSSTSSGDSSPVCGKVSPTSSGSICWPSLFILVVVTTRLTLLLTRTPFSSIYSSTCSGDPSPVCATENSTFSGSICCLLILVVVTSRLTVLLTRTPFSSICSSTCSGDPSPVCAIENSTFSGSIFCFLILVVVTSCLTVLLTRTPFSSIYSSTCSGDPSPVCAIENSTFSGSICCLLIPVVVT